MFYIARSRISQRRRRRWHESQFPEPHNWRALDRNHRHFPYFPGVTSHRYESAAENAAPGRPTLARNKKVNARNCAATQMPAGRSVREASWTRSLKTINNRLQQRAPIFLAQAASRRVHFILFHVRSSASTRKSCPSVE